MRISATRSFERNEVKVELAHVLVVRNFPF